MGSRQDRPRGPSRYSGAVSEATTDAGAVTTPPKGVRRPVIVSFAVAFVYLTGLLGILLGCSCSLRRCACVLSCGLCGRDRRKQEELDKAKDKDKQGDSKKGI